MTNKVQSFYFHVILFCSQDALPLKFIKAIDQIDYTSPVTKINGMFTLFQFWGSHDAYIPLCYM